MKIDRIENSKVPYELLFLADEDDDQIKKYKDSADFFAATANNDVVGIIGINKINEDETEIVNLAVSEKYQNKNIGTELVEKAISDSKEKEYRRIIVKTGDCGITQLYFYQRCGFRFDSIVKDYFLDNYKVPIFENTIQCRDQIILEYKLYTDRELDKKITEYWNRFIKENNDYKDHGYEVWNFCYGEYLPNKLLGLVREGKKTGTSSAKELYEEDEKLPEAGDLSIITYGNGLPGCIIETKEIRIKKFNKITADEARLEGEGDLSLEYWQKAHEWFFKLDYNEAGKQFTDEIPVIFQRFEVIYDEDRKI